jgi:hypothetical protein
LNRVQVETLGKLIGHIKIRRHERRGKGMKGKRTHPYRHSGWHYSHGRDPYGKELDDDRMLEEAFAEGDYGGFRVHQAPRSERTLSRAIFNRNLAGWAGAFSSWASAGKDVYCFFDNDEAGYAPRDALRLLEMVKDG